ncbi:hypothetical protein [Tomitella fengzijianii]|uniref:hypothetical protein n=1 Tax=Tomitella fengzijianii TaxID=2597660 RepID=UPI00131E0577|nr:hypothetical protein [Tomitella fengzijianii]
MWEPEGPLPQQIYRRRRFAAVGVALVVLIVVVVLIAVSCGGNSDEPTAAAAVSSSPEPAAPAASSTAAPTGTATPSGTAGPSGEAPQPAGAADPDGPQQETVPGGQCADSSIGLTVAPEKPNYAVGESVTFISTITNIGSVPCVRDLSGPMIVNTVESVDGGEVWSNADCFPGTGSDIRTLEPGQQAQFKMVWAGTTSSQGCTPADRKQVPPGVYAVTTHLGSMSGKPVPFNIH